MNSIYPAVHFANPVKPSKQLEDNKNLRREFIRSDLKAIDYCLSFLEEKISALSNIDAIDISKNTESVAVQIRANKIAKQFLMQMKGELEKRKTEI